VVNLVTRGTIEEKVLRTLESKQSLFEGVFAGEADEIPFESAQKTGFLEIVRELVEESPELTPEVPKILKQSICSTASGSTVPTSSAVWLGIAQLLEAASMALLDPKTFEQIPGELKEKLQSAANAIAQQLNSKLGS
jgi:hypothetical protein